MSPVKRKNTNPKPSPEDDLPPIAPVTPAVVGEKEKFLLYGNPKTGKTHCGLTLPEPILFVAVGGPNEIKTFYSKKFQDKYPGRQPPILCYAGEEIGDKGRFEHALGFDRVTTQMGRALEMDARGELEFASIVVDNATVLSELQMNKVIEIGHENRNPDAKGYSTFEKFKEHGILTPFDAEWGAAQSLMQKFTSWIFSLDKHVAFIAHEYEVSVPNRATQGQDLVGVKPLFIGKQRDRIANMFDNVWRFYTQGQLHVARTIPQDQPFTIIAGSRIGGVVSSEYQDPNLSAAIRKFQAHAESVGKSNPSSKE